MTRAILRTIVSSVGLALAAGSLQAAPTYDPTFEPNVRSPFNQGSASNLQTIKMASDGGYFFDGGGYRVDPPLPCSPTYSYNMPMPGNEGVFISSHYFYRLIKLKENGEMDCDFTLMRANYSGVRTGGIFPDDAGRIYFIDNAGVGLYLYDSFASPKNAGMSSYSIARFSERTGELDGAFILSQPYVNGQRGVFEGIFKPPLASGLNDNRINAVGFDQSASTPFAPKLVVGGFYQYSREHDFKHIWRLNPDGSTDHSFQPVKLGSSVLGPAIRKIQVLPSGKILVGGGFKQVNGSSFYRSFIRLNSDGTLDESFQAAVEPGSTYAGFEFNTQGGVRDFIVQPDGKIILVGDFFKYDGAVGLSYLARLNPDGSLDHSFTPPDFIVNSMTSQVKRLETVALQDDGKIILAGEVWRDPARGISAVMRLNPDGTLDETFRIDFTADHYKFFAQSAVFDQECRLMIAFLVEDDELAGNVVFPLTGQVVSAPNGLIRVKIEDGVGCNH